SQSGKGTFHKVAFSCRCSASSDQQIRVEPCSLEDRCKVGMIVWSGAFIARFSTGGAYQSRERGGIAVPHLAVRRLDRHIDELVACANNGNSRASKYAHRKFSSECQECQFSGVQYFTHRNKFIALTKVFARREHAIAGSYRRENSHTGSISLGAFLRNHGIGAAWNRCAGRNGQSSSGGERRFTFFSEHLPGHGKLYRILLCCYGTVTRPHRGAIHCRAQKRHCLFLGNDTCRRDWSKRKGERDILLGQRLHSGEDRSNGFVEAERIHHDSPERCVSSSTSRRIVGRIVHIKKPRPELKRQSVPPRR